MSKPATTVTGAPRPDLSSDQIHLDEQFAQLKLVAMFEGLGHVGIQSFAVEQGPVGASLVFHQNRSTPPKDAGMFTGDTILHSQVVSQVDFGEDILRGIAATQADRLYQCHFQFPLSSASADAQPNGQWPGTGQVHHIGLGTRNSPKPRKLYHIHGVGFKLLIFQEICPAFGTVYGVGNVPGSADATLNHSVSPQLGYEGIFWDVSNRVSYLPILYHPASVLDSIAQTSSYLNRQNN